MILSSKTARAGRHRRLREAKFQAGVQQRSALSPNPDAISLASFNSQWREFSRISVRGRSVGVPSYRPRDGGLRLLVGSNEIRKGIAAAASPLPPGSPALCSTSFIMSALADLSTICVTIVLRRDPAALSVDRHDDRLVQRVGQRCQQALGAAAAGVAGLPLLEAGVQRRPARAHLVTALAVRHRAAPPCRFGACICSQHVLVCQLKMSEFIATTNGAKCRRKFSLQPPSGAPNASLLPEPCSWQLII